MKTMNMIRQTCILLVVLLFAGCNNNGSNEAIQTQLGEEAVSEEVDHTSSVNPDDREEQGADRDIETNTASQEGHAGTATDVAVVDVKEAVEQMLKSMTLEEKVGQLFYVDLETYESTEIAVGGIILFKPDLTTWNGTVEMIRGYQQGQKIPLFFGVDEEGGLVTRITGEGSIGGTVIDKAWNLAHSGDETAVYEANRTIAGELAELGFNMNFAPVADINSNPSNPIIGKRAFSDKPEETAKYVLEAMRGYEATKVIPVVKHFPGHGDTKGDSHLDTVTVEGDIDDLLQMELVPFKAAIDQGIEVVMMGHISLPEIVTSGYPASLSKEVIQGILMDRLGFEGLVISDALNMGSIYTHYSTEEVMDRGLDAGLDLFLMPNEPERAYNHLLEEARNSEEVVQRVEASVRKILAIKMTF